MVAVLTRDPIVLYTIIDHLHVYDHGPGMMLIIFHGVKRFSFGKDIRLEDDTRYCHIRKATMYASWYTALRDVFIFSVFGAGASSSQPKN